MKMSPLYVLLSHLVHVTRSSVSGWWPESYAVVGRGHTYTLQCGQHTDHILWISPNGDYITDITLQDLDEPNAGNYTCWSIHGQLHAWVYLLIKEHDDLDISCFMESLASSLLQCSAPVYIEMDIYRVTVDTKPLQQQQWVRSQRYGDLLRFNVTLPKFCPYGEQIIPIEVKVEGRTDSAIVSGFRIFYINEIVVPRPPENVVVKVWNTWHVGVSWQYPSSWPRPLSFFPLLFEIKLKHKDKTYGDTRVEGAQNLTVSTSVWSLRMRCRDLFYPSQWSAWTPELVIPDQW